MAEARVLARPCVRLSVVNNRSQPVGRWGGPASPGIHLEGPHLLSFDLRALPEEFLGYGLTGCASIHEGHRTSESQFAVSPHVPDWNSYPRARRRRRTLKNPFTGEVMGHHALYDDLKTRSACLYAHPDLSLPSLEDLVLHGTSTVARFLEVEGGSLEDWSCGRLPENSSVKAYQDAWHLHLLGTPEEREKYDPTLARGGTVAVLGGWPIPIVFSYEDPHAEGRLLISTFAQSEPWRQVWLRADGSFAVRDIST